jgi:hypothetical protein
MVDLHKAWALFMSDPVDFILMFVIVAGAVGGSAWWLRSFIAEERIATGEATLKEKTATSEEHLKLAREKYDNAQADLQKLTVYTRQLESMLMD